MTAPEYETLGILQAPDLDTPRDIQQALDPVEVAPEATPPVVDDRPAPTTFPPAPDLGAQVARLVEIQTAEMENRQREAAARREQDAQMQVPKPLMEQPEWKAAYMADLSASSYDEEAAARLMQRNMQLTDERATQLVEQRLGQFQQQNQTQMLAERAPTLISSAAALASRENPLVTSDLFTEAANTVFKGNPGLLAQALSDERQGPETTRMLGIYAAGLAATRGQVGQDTRPAPPVNARPVSQQPGSTPSNEGMWGDTKYVNGVLADAWSNPHGDKK